MAFPAAPFIALFSYVGVISQVKRCAEMSRKQRFFKDQIHKAGLMSAPRPILQPEMELEQLEILLAEYEHELLEMNNNSEQLRQSYNELLELKIVLQKVSISFSSVWTDDIVCWWFISMFICHYTRNDGGANRQPTITSVV
ncbi:hypothetical protein RHMOL_Rhmol08G0143500 [Rhododendron molle]|uniref:Uncharacterized protein n=1 Tax=Rhododendron molle TaxID=49168 RepID=A0ACC0MPG0_RHOML|nr:hypothetical protein RHMOL_Rhmol08G0143500 [Rhododendron molle]